MLELKPTRNVVEVTIHGHKLELYYRTPTTKELVAYNAARYVRQGKKILDRTLAARIEAGTKVLEGFAPGCMAVEGVPITSEAKPPKEMKFYPEWKKLLVENYPLAVAVVGQVAFDCVQTSAQGAGLKEDDIEVVLDAGELPAATPEADVPLAKG